MFTKSNSLQFFFVNVLIYEDKSNFFKLLDRFKRRMCDNLPQKLENYTIFVEINHLQIDFGLHLIS